ncbi:MAG: carboxyl transferase domain-containing protein [Planctomycetota bacterium]|nr:carboxyl transferase domain-containing protein [Planctomycetota bacterium]
MTKRPADSKTNTAHGSAAPASTSAAPAAPADLRATTAAFLAIERKLKEGGGAKAIERQHEKGRLTARERIDRLVDPGSFFQEYGLWSAYEMYKEHGGAPAAGVVTGVGVVHGRRCMIIANDATVKAGAFFPMTCKKIIRAQTMAMMARLPLVYLVDSAGVFLPMQEDVFPDTDDFGRIFRNNAVLSAEGIPQIAAIMGFCVAGGGYLPVLCDTLLMTEGSGLYLAGQALVKAAIGQEVTDEELGGASMHASISGTIDFKEKDDEACIVRLRSLLAKYAPSQREGDGGWVRAAQSTPLLRNAVEKMDQLTSMMQEGWLKSQVDALLAADNASASGAQPTPLASIPAPADGIGTYRDANDIYTAFTDKPGAQYDVRDVIHCIVDVRAEPNDHGHESLAPDFDEYKAEYGQSIVCGYATIGGHACGIVANQKKLVQRTMPGGKNGPTKAVQMPGVIYDDSADKSARFIMDCNQRKIPLVFLHDTTGFMVGRDSEQGGIIRAGAKMVNAMSNCIVPKIVVILGGSYGAGNYAMCGRAFDQFIAFAWPGSKCAVMGANQATGVLTTIEEASRKRKGETIDPEAHKQIYSAIHAGYTEQADIRHGAARGWVDRIIEPHKTRDELIAALDAAAQGWDYSNPFKTGVLQT